MGASPDHGNWGVTNFNFEAQVRLSFASQKGRDPRRMGPSRPILPMPRAQIILGSRRTQPRRKKLLRFRPSTIGKGMPETVHGCFGRCLPNAPVSDADPTQIGLRQKLGALRDLLPAG